jgi:selenocysteine lyase/cysteine desulfurase
MLLPIHEIREDFPVTKQIVYLNHAAVSPLCRPAAVALEWFAQDALNYGSLHYERWLAACDGLRRATATMINATPEEIAIVKNTSEGIATVAMGLDWRRGDRVVLFKDEFPANQYPWQRLERKGVNITWLNFTDPLDRIAEATRGARLLAISFVQFLSGYRADLKGIGQICRDAGCIFFVDAIQGMGVFPLDVHSYGIHALAADGHKWLLGPEGCGVLYIHKDLQPMVEPMEFGWMNVASAGDYSLRSMDLRGDATRYECGTLNTPGCFALGASMEYILRLGVENIGPVVQALADRVAEGVEKKGYTILGTRTPDTGAGIVSFRKDGVDSTVVAAALRANGVIGVARAGWVRLSPHFYILPEEIDRAIGLLP